LKETKMEQNQEEYFLDLLDLPFVEVALKFRNKLSQNLISL